MNPKCVAFLIVAMLAVSSLLTSAQANREQGTSQPARMPVSEPKSLGRPIASVQGPSWLTHLGLTVSTTRMGQMGGTDITPSTSALNNLSSIIQRFLSTFRSSPEKASEILNEKFAATGSDLYRWNCQACHGSDGKGAAPEINSLLGPVQGTSPALTKKRMEARGIDADDEMVKQVSELAEASLRDRFQHGGKSMPAFEYLRGDEVEALLGYLEKLAAVPPTKRDGLVVPESAARVGEHIVKGTCHICHDATGPGGGYGTLTQGVIPPLGSMPRNHSLSGVVHQVQYGSSGLMKMAGAEVMPAYPYFTQEEIAATYLAGYATSNAAQRDVAADRVSPARRRWMGTATISASYGSLTGGAALTVTGAKLVSIAVSPVSPVIALGRTQQFAATGSFDDNTTQDISNSAAWSSSVTGIAIVNNLDLATSTGTGATSITAASAGVSGATTLNVQ